MAIENREPETLSPPAAVAPRARRLRWWPAALIVLASLGALSAIFFADSLRHTAQFRLMWIQATLAVTGLLLFVWFVLASGLSGRMRLVGGSGVVLLVVAFVGLFRVEGVTGDLRPIIAPRFRFDGERRSDSQPGRVIDLGQTSPVDFPQFLGPHRDATIDAVRLNPDWQATPPKPLWRQPIGKAWSAFVVVGDYAITQEQHGADEEIVCYEARTGKVVWRYAYPALFESVIAGTGPRATPSVAEGRVYAVGSTGILTCLDGSNGTKLWSRNTFEDAHGTMLEWGDACSPLVTDAVVIVSTGGPNGWSMAAYHKDSGEIAWHAGDAEAAYDSPILANLCGVPQILILNRLMAVAHDPSDGHILWEHAWGGGDSLCANPIVVGDDQLFLSTGYGYGCALWQLKRDAASGKFEITEDWPRNRNMKFKFTNGVQRDGYIYGMDDGVLACLDLKTGKRKWKAGRYGHGQLLLVGDLLLVQAESGELLLVKASPDKLTEVAQMPGFDEKTWNSPALSGALLLVRNDKEAACYELPLATP